MSQHRVLVVGAGLAGLACAIRLRERGVETLVLEASDAPGGGVRTDGVDGFLLDRGFQVLLTAYPETRRLLDYSGLELRKFSPGALIRFDGRFHRITDPLRQPRQGFSTLVSPVGTMRWPAFSLVPETVRRPSRKDNGPRSTRPRSRIRTARHRT